MVHSRVYESVLKMKGSTMKSVGEISENAQGEAGLYISAAPGALAGRKRQTSLWVFVFSDALNSNGNFPPSAYIPGTQRNKCLLSK